MTTEHKLLKQFNESREPTEFNLLTIALIVSKHNNQSTNQLKISNQSDLSNLFNQSNLSNLSNVPNQSNESNEFR